LISEPVRKGSNVERSKSRIWGLGLCDVKAFCLPPSTWYIRDLFANRTRLRDSHLHNEEGRRRWWMAG